MRRRLHATHLGIALSSMSSTAQLLQRVASLAAPERDQEVVRYARSSQDNLASVLAELDAGGMYERRLGALMAVATRDAAWITAHVADEDAALSRWAMKAAMVACPQALDASLEDAPAVRRAALINAVLQSHHGAKRTALADRLFPLFAEWSTEGVGLLAACSPGVVASALPSLLHAVTRWRPSLGPTLPLSSRHSAPTWLPLQPSTSGGTSTPRLYSPSFASRQLAQLPFSAH